MILQGARQVGKTWALKRFGQDFFDDTAYFNFEKQPGLRQFFLHSREPGDIITNLSILHAKPISPGNTLIIFDEIQECNDALNALKYFAEEAPEYVIRQNHPFRLQHTMIFQHSRCICMMWGCSGVCRNLIRWCMVKETGC